MCVCVFIAVCVQNTNSEYGSLWLPTALGVCSQCVCLCVFVFTALGVCSQCVCVCVYIAVCVQSINSEYGSP